MWLMYQLIWTWFTNWLCVVFAILLIADWRFLFDQVLLNSYHTATILFDHLFVKYRSVVFSQVVWTDMFSSSYLEKP
jgi:hypothetical protein